MTFRDHLIHHGICSRGRAFYLQSGDEMRWKDARYAWARTDRLDWLCWALDTTVCSHAVPHASWRCPTPSRDQLWHLDLGRLLGEPASDMMAEFTRWEQWSQPHSYETWPPAFAVLTDPEHVKAFMMKYLPEWEAACQKMKW